MSAGVRVRAATADDLPFMREMLVEAAYPPDQRKPSVDDALAFEPTRRYIDGWGRRGDSGVIAVDTVSGERVGAAWYRLFARAAPGFGFVDELTPEITIAVVSERRRQGTGNALLAALLEFARSQGFEALSLSVSPKNPAVRLYTVHGFVRVHSRDEHWTMRVALG